MTKEQIKKVLECCVSSEFGMCKQCPNYDSIEEEDCADKLKIQALDLIIEQEQIIENLNGLVDYADKEIRKLRAEIKQAEIDVLNELRNKCHNYYPSIDHYCCSVKAVNLSDINKMIEELNNGTN